jgi:hypothetical protein
MTLKQTVRKRISETCIGVSVTLRGCNGPTTAHIFSICQIVEKKWEYKEAVHQLFIDFKKAYDSVRREVFYNILIEYGTP